MEFRYDAAGRLASRRQPDDKLISFDYDGTGNVTSITPPERPAHSFAFTPVNLPDSPIPPSSEAPRRHATRSRSIRIRRLYLRPDGQTVTADLRLGRAPSQHRRPRLRELTYDYDRHLVIWPP